jgi:hypothetical protein
LTILQKAKNAFKKYKTYLYQYQIFDIKRIQSIAQFDSYVKRGGFDAIWTRKQLSGIEDFLQDIDEVGNFISSIFTKVCPTVTNQISSVDLAIRF